MSEGSNDKYLVSAVVSMYNCERFIEGCLEDLENQTIADRLEIITVNSGSQENEKEIVQEFQRKYDNIVYLETKERETIYKAWNRGIKVARGKYITNANSDDRRRRDAYEIMSSILEETDFDLVYPNYKITDNPNETFENTTSSQIRKLPDYDRVELLFIPLPGPFPMWRKSIHERFGFFDESYQVAGDFEFWLRISDGCRFFHINECLGLYYRNLSGGELGNPLQNKIEYIELVNRYVDEFIESQRISNKETILSLRKRQSEVNFNVADFFCFQDRVDLSIKYILKSLKYGGNYYKILKLLFYCFLPKEWKNAIVFRKSR